MAKRPTEHARKADRRKQKSAHQKWLSETIPAHARLTSTIVSLLRNILDERQIEFLNVVGRTKTVDGALEKIRRKKYRDPQSQLTDLSGIRVITYLESQVDQVGEVIRGLFDVDDANSLDRAKVLGSDKIGYRSTHFVCSLGTSRGALAEYESMGSLKFEIQVRTVLQHGWAELAHDRSFKFGPGLPTHIQRKLNLYAGMLEIVDSAFDSIAQEIEEYTKSIKEKTIEQISLEEISTLTLEKYLVSIAKTHKIAFNDFEFSPEIFDELDHFGIKTTGDLDKLSTNENISAYKSVKDADTGIGFIREMMMLADLKRYFSGPFEWRGLDEASYNRLLKRYEKRTVDRMLTLFGIALIPDPDFSDLSFDQSNGMDDEIPF